MIKALEAKKAAVERKIAFYEECILTEKAKLGLIDEMIGDELKANGVATESVKAEAVVPPAVAEQPIVVSYGIGSADKA